jgi:hypothetical protein
MELEGVGISIEQIMDLAKMLARFAAVAEGSCRRRSPAEEIKTGPGGMSFGCFWVPPSRRGRLDMRGETIAG